MFVLVEMACEAGLEITGLTGKKKSCSNKGLSDQECEIVKEFYLEKKKSVKAFFSRDYFLYF